MIPTSADAPTFLGFLVLAATSAVVLVRLRDPRSRISRWVDGSSDRSSALTPDLRWPAVENDSPSATGSTPGGTS